MKTEKAWQRPPGGEINRHFANFIARFGGEEGLVRRAVSALCRSVREGHTCINLARLSESDGAADGTGAPTPAQWRDELQKSSAVGPPEAATPLVLDHANRLYLRRYWNYQAKLARSIRVKCSRNPPADPTAGSTQEEALAAALRNELTIICGGPGTGKTSTVTRILARLLREPGGERLRVALTAPTGKAASRLDEAVRKAGEELPPAEGLRDLMPPGARTIHRLLGSRFRSTSFRHNAENPLPLDFLIVDEASMVSLALLAKLFDALPDRCRVLLLGDRDQLAAVEPGVVLADVIDAAAEPASPLRGSVVNLTKNYRFRAGSSIQAACDAVRRGETDGMLAMLRGARQPDLPTSELSTLAELHRWLAPAVSAGFAGLVAEKDPAAALLKLPEFMVLSPLRQGPWGVTGLNRFIMETLREAGLCDTRGGAFHAGCPILILQNDYELDLYNGDLGLLLPDPAETPVPGQLYAWFSGRQNRVRRFPLARLPEHETAYAMTVHKSQGSEFERVLFVLPGSDSPLLTRELVYTALTRARSVVGLCWNEPVLRAALSRHAQRESGLRDLLNAAA